jgi:hypothetical protein
MKIKELTDVPAVRDYLNRVGAEPRSLKTAVVRQTAGKYWRDLAVIRFTKDGDIDCSTLEHAPTDLERQMVKDALASVTWPEVKLLSRIVDPHPMIAAAAQEDIFEFRNLEGQIVMVQVRQEKGGDKTYVPFTYWDDDQWRICEPDGPLPLFNADKIGDNSTVFIHEGAKAARHMQWLSDAADKAAQKALAEHPWGRELSGAVHVGWIGGALSPYRTDWSVLKQAGVKRAYIVADNDEPGRSAVPAIAQHLRMPTFTVQFTDEFPASFDLADQFPATMFSNGAGERVYTGPSFRDCLHPATWATDIVPPKKDGGRPGHVLRDSFKGMWAYIEEADMFVCTEMPEIMRNEAILNKMLASFSHVNDTCRLIVKAYQGRSTRVCYRPDADGLKVTFRGSSAINLHVPSNVRAQPGDPSPFLDFMKYMFVNEKELHEVLRWCATLIAKPEVRMHYGLLLISERQGVGKTTLGASILAPLVGIQNVGFPGENDVTSSFNEWVAHKRLAIVSEIYSGSSWKAYHALKSVITDKDITVNQKYMRQYTIENWCHVLASSNSMRALKMENDDRRWFYPEVTEVPWPRERFDKLRKWLNAGGLSIIKHWAEGFGDYVNQSERAPMTDRKREMIEGSRSEAQQEAAAIAETLKDLGKPAAVLIKDVVGWVRAHVQGRVFDTDYELRRAMCDAGLVAWQKRVKVHGRLQYAVLNQELVGIVQHAEDPLAAIRDALVKVSDIMDGEM